MPEETPLNLRETCPDCGSEKLQPPDNMGWRYCNDCGSDFSPDYNPEEDPDAFPE